MENLFFKQNTMNYYKANESIMRGHSLDRMSYNYQNSKVISADRKTYSKSYKFIYNPTHPFKLVKFVHKGIIFNMIICPPGSLIIDGQEKTVDKYFMLGETKVTQELFDAIMGFNPSKFKGMKKPVDNVTWYDCLVFCNKLSVAFDLKPCYDITPKSYKSNGKTIENANYALSGRDGGFRLPSETEWQLAAASNESDDKFMLSNINNLMDESWFVINSNGNRSPVAQKKPNSWGFYDMIGGTREWCIDKKDVGQRIQRGVPDTLSQESLKKDYGDISFLRKRSYEDEGFPAPATGFRIALSIEY